MDISQPNIRPPNFSFTQGIGDVSAKELDSMDISDLMSLVMSRMLDVNEAMFKQKLFEAEARTKKLEVLGDQMKALARLNAEYGAEDKDDTKLRDSKGGKDKVSSDQWDESAIDNTLANSSSASSSSKSTSSSKNKSIDNLTTDEKAAVFDRAANNLQEAITAEEREYLYGDGGNGTGDPVLDKSIEAKMEKAWHDTGYDVPANTDSNRGAIWDRGSKVIDKNPDWNDGFKQTRSHLGERMERALTAHYNSEVKTDETTAAADKTTDVDLSSPWRADLTDEGKQLMEQNDRFCESGLANGTLTETDAANIKSGNFKKSDLDALQVAIKNEQEKIGSLNTQEQLGIQKLTSKMDALQSLISTLTKKFSDATASVINKF
jgi:hypothetical protein